MILELIFNKGVILPALASIFCLIVSLIGFELFRLKKIQANFKKHGIPGPEPSLFEGGNFSEILATIQTGDKVLEWSRFYGKYFGFTIGRTNIFITTDLELLKKLFFENHDVFTERQDTVILVHPIADSVLFAKYSRWKQMRKALSPAFSFYGSKSPNSTEAVEKTINQFISYLDSNLTLCDGKKVAKNIKIHDLMKAMALGLISLVAIRLKECPVKPDNVTVRRLDAMMEKFETGIVIFSAMFPVFTGLLGFIANNFEYKTVLTEIHKEVEREVEDGLAFLRGETKDKRLAAIYHNKQPDAIIHKMIVLVHEEKMTKIELMGNVEAILIAGYDTTSTTLTYCFWCLGKYPEIQERVRDDTKRYGVESQYLRQFLNEAMRIYPAVSCFTRRRANRDLTIDGISLFKNVEVVYNVQSVHLDPNIWPDPLKFDPDRFHPDAHIHPCAFAPFGLSERRCLGYKLALLEMLYALTYALAKYRVILVEPETLEIIPSANVLTKPKNTVIIDFELIED